MRILIIGDDPKITGGVANYTRPLFHRFRLDHECDYLYTTSYNKDYSLLRRTRVIEEEGGLYRLQNSQVLYKVKHSLINDFKETESDKVLLKFIQDKHYAVVHIHSMLGLSTSIYSTIKKLGVKLFVTVHEYWWLCPRQVMIDYKGQNCEGPQDLVKCSNCALSALDSSSIKSVKLKSTLKREVPQLLRLAVQLKKNLAKDESDSQSFNSNVSGEQSAFVKQIESRLRHNIHALNLVDRVVCVSADVQDHLIKYGVRKEQLLVQHIGSQIADSQVSFKVSNHGPLRIGYIGGITYYKGVHLLVDSFLKLSEDLLSNIELHLYGSYHEDYMEEMKINIGNYPLHAEKIFIHGRYSFDSLPEILESLTINVLPSLCADTAPQTIFESYSRRIPVIGPSIGGFRDFIVDGVNGRIFEAGNSDSLKECLEDLIKDPSQIYLFSEKIPKLKTLDENVEELAQLYIND